MSIYEVAQLLIALGVILISVLAGNRRGVAWVIGICISLALSTTAWVNHVPYAAVITALCDFSLCVVIHYFGRNRWELWLFLLYQFSMLVSILYFASSLAAPGWADHDTYSSILEAVNYVAFLLIGTISGVHLASDSVISAPFRPWRRIRLFVHPRFREDA